MKTRNIFSVRDRIAVVTGGFGQLGASFCVALAEQGAKVAVYDLVDKLKVPNPAFDAFREKDIIRPYHVDITNLSSVETATTDLEARWGCPSILVNNAALDSPPNAPVDEVGPFENYPEASFDKVMDVNVKGTFFCCQAIGGRMAHAGLGSIINISSIYGILSPRQDIYEYRRKAGTTFFKPVAYSVSKSALLNLTRYLATYWASKGIRVNTMTLAGVFNNQPAPFLDAYLPHVPLRRMATPDDYIGALLFLASDASSYMTGSNLVIDGGWSAW